MCAQGKYSFRGILHTLLDQPPRSLGHQFRPLGHPYRSMGTLSERLGQWSWAQGLSSGLLARPPTDSVPHMDYERLNQ